MSRVLIAQLGARRHYAVPRALHRSAMLDSLVTDVCADVPPWRWLTRLVPESRRGERFRRLMGRSVPEVPAESIAGLPSLDFQLYPRQPQRERRTDYWARRNAAFCRAVVRRGFGDANTVYAFNGAALEIFQAAKRFGLRTVLDQTAAPWRWNARLLQEEVTCWPGWEDRPAELDESGALSEREEAEWELADAIICGSEFCRSTLTGSGVPVAKCHVLSPPFNQEIEDACPRRSIERSGALRVLFVGTLQLRKGVPYLYEAVRQLRLDSIEFRLVGPSLLSTEANRKLGEFCDITGAVPRAAMAAHYRWADVLVLPTLSEGSANACHEAMAMGIPVVTTLSAGSAIRNGHNGLIVPAKDSRAIAEYLAWMIADPDARTRLGNAAKLSMERFHRQDIYSDQLRSLLEGIGIDA